MDQERVGGLGELADYLNYLHSESELIGKEAVIAIELESLKETTGE